MKENIKLAKELVKVAKQLFASSATLYCKNSLFTVVIQDSTSRFDGYMDDCIDDMKSMASTIKNRAYKFVEAMDEMGYKNVELYRKPAEIWFKNNNVYIAYGGNLHDSQDNEVIRKCCEKAKLNFVPGDFNV